MNLPKSEVKAKNESEVIQEMLPFALYAALPILLTILIAYTMGSTQQ